MPDRNKNKVLTSQNTTSKNFSYTKGNVSLNFVLRTDIKQELKDFLECLEAAVVEVKREIEVVGK